MARSREEALFIKDMYKVFWDEEKYPTKPTVFDQIYVIKNDVKGAGDKENSLLGMGDLKQAESETEDIYYESPNSGREILVAYKRFQRGLSLSFEEVEDSIKAKNLIGKYVSSWKHAIRRNKETYAALPFNEGGNLLGHAVFDGSHTGNSDSSGNLMFDNKPFFNLSGNTRTSKGGTTYFNSVSGLSLSSSNLQTLYILMTSTNNRNDIDSIVENKPDTLLTQVGADEFTAYKILQTLGENQSEVGTSNNDTNVWQQGRPNFVGRLQHISWDYLNDTSSPFYLLKRKTEAMEFHMRQEPRFDLYQVPQNKSYRADVTTRFGIKINDWRHIVRGGGTSA